MRRGLQLARWHCSLTSVIFQHISALFSELQVAFEDRYLCDPLCRCQAVRCQQGPEAGGQMRNSLWARGAALRAVPQTPWPAAPRIPQNCPAGSSRGAAAGLLQFPTFGSPCPAQGCTCRLAHWSLYTCPALSSPQVCSPMRFLWASGGPACPAKLLPLGLFLPQDRAVTWGC